MKKALAVSLDKELIEWINSRVSNEAGFRNRSHLVEEALNKFKNELSAADKKMIQDKFKIEVEK